MVMLPRRAMLAGGAAALVASSAAWAQEAGRTYRLGMGVQSARDAAHWVALFEELHRAGFTEGSNLSIMGEFGVALGRADAAAVAVVEARPDVILTAGLPLTRAMQRATKTIPIMTVSDDLVAEQLAGSFAHPGGSRAGHI